MNISIQVRTSADEPCEKQMDVPDNITYDVLLDILSINQETVIVLNDGMAVPLDETVTPGNIIILKAISGG